MDTTRRTRSGRLAGAEGAPVRRSRRHLLPPLAPLDEAPSPPPRSAGASEPHDLVAMLTVYTLNVTVMIFAFPAGFGLLVYNVLGGENLRTTAHVMALTGLACALPFLGAAAPFAT